MASLPIFNTDNRDLSMMQTRWASLINPLLSNVLSEASLLKNIALSSGLNTINHLQGRVLNGYIVVGMHGAYAQIFDVPSPLPKLTLLLNASAPTIIDLAVF